MVFLNWENENISSKVVYKSISKMPYQKLLLSLSLIFQTINYKLFAELNFKGHCLM